MRASRFSRDVRKNKTPPRCWHRKRVSMIVWNSLKKHIDDLLPFIEKLQGQGADVEGASMPTNANQQRSHRTSLSIARKKMRALHARRDF